MIMYVIQVLLSSSSSASHGSDIECRDRHVSSTHPMNQQQASGPVRQSVSSSPPQAITSSNRMYDSAILDAHAHTVSILDRV
jgi:hypothetical protein